MPNSFDKVRSKYQDSPMAVVLFIAAATMFILGLWHFAEDTYSSFLGLQEVQRTMNLNVQIFDGTYWTMSLAPQIASIVFFYLYLSTGEKKYLWGSIVAQGVDFMADTWYRSNGQLLDNMRVAVVSAIFTFAYFTLGSEVFITIGAGLVLRLFAPFIREGKKAIRDVQSAWQGKGGGDGKPKQNFQSHQSHQVRGGGGGGKSQPTFQSRPTTQPKGFERRKQLEAAHRTNGHSDEESEETTHFFDQ